MLRYVKLTQNCFPTDEYAVQSDGWVSYEGTVSSNWYYFRVPCAVFYSNSWCDGYWAFGTQYCGDHSNSVSYKGYLGWNLSWTDTSSSNGEVTVSGVKLEGKAQFWTGNWHDQGNYYIKCYEIGNSRATTAYNYIANRGYKFAGVSTTNAYQTSSYSASDYCNSYVYPGTGKLMHLMPIP